MPDNKTTAKHQAHEAHEAHEAECKSAAIAYLKEKRSPKYKVSAAAPSKPPCSCAECGKPTRLHFAADTPGCAGVALCINHAPAWAQEVGEIHPDAH
jgi:hypothetical protein